MARVIALVLALTLALTAQAYALARGQAADGIAMVICTEGGTVVVTLDAEGQPTGQRHLCPDAVMVFGAMPGAPADAVVPDVPGLPAEPAVRAVDAPSRPGWTVRARGPPGVI